MLFKDGPFKEINDGPGTETADKLVETEVKDDEQKRHTGPGVHGPAGESLGKGRAATFLLRNDPIEKPFADPFAFQADSQVQVDTPGENDIIHGIFDAGVFAGFALPDPLCDLFYESRGVWMQLAAVLVHEERKRYAPGALT